MSVKLQKIGIELKLDRQRFEIIFSSKVTFDSDEELSPAERKKVEKMQERQAKAVARFPIIIIRMRMIGMMGMKRSTSRG